MKQLMKHFLRNLPPFKQFLARMKHLEERMLAETDRIQRETNQIRKEVVIIQDQLQRQNREKEALQAQLQHQNTELDYLNQKLEQVQKENVSLCQILESQKITIDSYKRESDAYQSNTAKTLTGIRLDQKEFSNQMKKINLETRRINVRINETNKEANYLYFKGLHPDAYKDALADWFYQRGGYILT
ncbi:MAG: hypothetical protein LUE65_00640 [Clostridiales bacterium]|nr:hypothetical protein [Clostridiales bacterium]